MILYFYCAFTGRLARWNRLSQKVILKAQTYIGQCPEDERKPFMAFVLGADFALRHLLHPLNGSKRLLTKDIKAISETEFMELHFCMLNHLLAIHFSINKKQDANNTGRNFSKFTGKDFFISKPVKISMQSTSIDLLNLSENIRNEASTILHYEEDAFLWLTAVPHVLSEYYKFSLDFITSNSSYIIIES